MDLQWRIIVIGIPVVGALFWLLFHHRDGIDTALQGVKDELANYKLLVATSFVSVHLEKIERRSIA